MDNIDITTTEPVGLTRVRRDNVWRTGYTGKRVYDELGNLAPHPVNWRRYTTTANPRFGKYNTAILEVWNGDWGDPTSNLIPVAIRNEVRDAAAVKWYKKLANTNALLAMMFHERQQTIDLVAEKIRSMYNIRKDFVKKFRRYVRRKKYARHEFESKWLEYRYGWLPTLSDIDTLINQELGHPKARIVGYASQLYNEETGNGISVGRTVLTANYKETFTAFVIAKNASLVAATQYGIANPSLIAWEAVPFSFMVDWFLDVGGYLESLGANNGLEIVSPSRSRYRSLTMIYAFDDSEYYSSGSCYHAGACGLRTIEKPSYPNPLIPSNGLNLLRLFDAIALVDSIWKKR